MFPMLTDLPLQMGTHAVIGAVGGYLLKVDPKVAACVCAIRSLADTLLFAIVNPFLGGDLGVRSMKVYLATFSLSSLFSMVMFRQLQLIGLKGTVVFGALASWVFAIRYKALQEMESAIT